MLHSEEPQAETMLQPGDSEEPQADHVTQTMS